MISHDIQLAILRQLIASPAGRRYAQMRPSEIENDRYNYHLQYLVKNGFVTKDAEHYRLSELGRHYILDKQPIDLAGWPIETFKLAVVTLVLREVGGKIEALYQTRTTEPSAGNQEIPGGSLRKGEPITVAASRRLQEETGLTADFQLIGLIRKIRYNNDKELYSDILYHVCLGRNPNGDLQKVSQFGTNQWISLKDAIKLEGNGAYGSRQLANVLKSLDRDRSAAMPLFYFEETYYDHSNT